MNYEIDKGIPIEPKGRYGIWARMAKEMEFGDSVLVNGRKEAMCLRDAIVRAGFKAVTRGNDKPKTRVWKVA